MSNLTLLLSPFRSRAVNALFLCTLVLLLALALLSASSAAGKAMTGQQRDATAFTAASAQVKYEPQARLSPHGLSVCGNITTDTTWTLADSPVVVTCSVTVKTGATLIIEPGVVVKFGSGYSLTVEQNATLRAEGTTESPIYFTSIKDDSVGGDTNGDGGATLPARGNWNKISVLGGDFPGTLIFDHVVVRYGGTSQYDYMVYVNGDGQIRNSVIEQSEYGGVYVHVATPTTVLESNTLRNNGSDGLKLRWASPTITGNTFSNNGRAILTEYSSGTISDNTINGKGILLLYDPSPTVSNNTLTRGAGSYQDTGIECHSSRPELSNNTVSGYEYPVKVIDGYPQVVPTYTGNTLTGNRYSNVVGVGGTLTSGSWTAQGGYTHVIAGDVTLPSGVELTVPAGTVIKFQPYTSLTVGQYATLRAEGTVESPIYFTSIKDDSVGGDTNGDGGATLPAKGDWDTIWVASSTTANPHGTLIFDHVVVRYGGRGSSDTQEMLDIGGDAQIRNSVIEHSQTVGIHIFRGPTLNPTVVIENTTLRYNNRRAVYVEGP